jgi:hypothetical protein
MVDERLLTTILHQHLQQARFLFLRLGLPNLALLCRFALICTLLVSCLPSKTSMLCSKWLLLVRELELCRLCPGVVVTRGWDVSRLRSLCTADT